VLGGVRFEPLDKQVELSVIGSSLGQWDYELAQVYRSRRETYLGEPSNCLRWDYPRSERDRTNPWVFA
jgi:hypothetical protein